MDHICKPLELYDTTMFLTEDRALIKKEFNEYYLGVALVHIEVLDEEGEWREGTGVYK